MSCPTIEDVTREFIRRLQVYFGGVWRDAWRSTWPYATGEYVSRGSTVYKALSATTGVDPATDAGVHWQVATRPPVDVYATDGTTSIEVVDASGAPVIEVQDRPKVSVIGPTLRRATRFGADPGRVLVSTDEDALTFTDAPAPMLRDLDYQLVVTAMRSSTSTSGSLGTLALKQRIELFGETGGAAGPYLLGSGWTGDEPTGAFRGYLIELATVPKDVPGESADLTAFSAVITIRDVRLTDGTQGTGQLTETLTLSVEPFPE